MELVKEKNVTKKMKKKTTQKPSIQQDLNADLEELRNEVIHVDNTEEILEEILPKIKNIHAAHLFNGYGLVLLQKLSIQIVQTRDTLYNSGWKDFAYELGIDSSLIKVIENTTFNNEDPVNSVILTYIQDENANLETILLALKKIKRVDVITETHELFAKFAEKINKTFKNDNQKLLKPSYIQPAPLVLSRLNEDPIEEDVPARPVYEKYVMLTYTNGSICIARMVAQILRKTGKIGVLILEEHARRVNIDFNTLITDCFEQADFIIPILSIEYLNTISSNRPSYTSNSGNLDNKYAKIIYELINSYYIDNGCCNDKIRTIIVDNKVDEVMAHHWMRKNELKAWFNLSDVKNVAKRILNDTI